ncbi:MAG: MFS transporter [Kofleriaceae bacterium]|nr:MFS transporter [Kofleriaceae bacterium]
MPTTTQPLLRFVVLYALLYGAFGVASPFLPALSEAHGLHAAQLGVVLAAGMAVRMLSSTFAGRIGDRAHALRRVLAVCAVAAALIALAYLPARGLVPLLVVTLLHGAMLAPLPVLADALSLEAAKAARGFEYGWVRGTGSLAFVGGTLLAGQLIGGFNLDVIVMLQAPLLLAVAIGASFVPEASPLRTQHLGRAPGVRALVGNSQFRRVIAVAALVGGSHALHDAFAVIIWTRAGVAPGAASLLWSESVISEVLVFFVVGPALLMRFPPGHVLVLAALAGVLRWAIAGHTTAVSALAAIQPLHGFTFSLLHLACMRLLARIVPAGLEGRAQAIYGTVAIGGTTALLTLISGVLFVQLDIHAFWCMAALCLVAMVPAARVRDARGPTVRN